MAEAQNKYYQKNKSIIRAKAKIRYYLEIEDIRKYQREWQKNNKKIIIYTKEQKQRRNIKRKTRLDFPLFKALKCNFCENPATEHHHNTLPIKIDKFNYICHSCHIDKNMDMKKQ